MGKSASQRACGKQKESEMKKVVEKNKQRRVKIFFAFFLNSSHFDGHDLVENKYKKNPRSLFTI